MSEPTWEQRWDARIAGMEATFGPHDDTNPHGTIPFDLGLDLGGTPDVIMFSSFVHGKLYDTADLIDSEQKRNSHGNYELAVAHQGNEDGGVDVICRLAHYTIHTAINDGETMDIGSAVPTSLES